jgi:hypothetical protein
MRITRSAFLACVLATAAPGGAAGTSTNLVGAVGDDATGGRGGPAGTNVPMDGGLDALPVIQSAWR